MRDRAVSTPPRHQPNASIHQVRPARAYGARSVGRPTVAPSSAMSTGRGASPRTKDAAGWPYGEGLVDGLALLAEHRVGVLRGERLPGRPVGDDHPPVEAAGADPHESDAVAVSEGLDMAEVRSGAPIALTLEPYRLFLFNAEGSRISSGIRSAGTQ